MCKKKKTCTIFYPNNIFYPQFVLGVQSGDKSFLDIDHLVLNQCYKHIHICNTDKMLFFSALSLNQFQMHIFMLLNFDLECKAKVQFHVVKRMQAVQKSRFLS